MTSSGAEVGAEKFENLAPEQEPEPLKFSWEAHTFNNYSHILLNKLKTLKKLRD